MSVFTFKTELHHIPKENGLHTVYLRITHNRKKHRISMGFSVDKRYWDAVKGIVKTSHPTASIFNDRIRKTIHQGENYVFEKQRNNQAVVISQLKGFLTGKSESTHTIYSYGMLLSQQLKGRFVEETLYHYKKESERINAYSPGVTFDQIDTLWLKNYELYLREKNFAHNSIHRMFKVLIKFFNSAIKDGITKNYPFKNFDKVKYKQPDKVHLTRVEVEMIHSRLNELTSVRLRRAAVWLLFGCYCGLRFSDWQRFSPAMIKGENIILRAKKNGQMVVMPIHPKLQDIISKINEVGPVEAEPNTNYYLKEVAKHFQIEKNLTTHIGRHSFAVGCAERGMSIETTAELLGITVKTCEVYYKVTGLKVRQEMQKWF